MQQVGAEAWDTVSGLQVVTVPPHMAMNHTTSSGILSAKLISEELKKVFVILQSGNIAIVGET